MDPILNINKSVFSNYNRYGKLIGVNNKGKTFEKIYNNGNIRVLTSVSPLGEVLKTVTKYLEDSFAKIVAKDFKTGNVYTLTRDAQIAQDATKVKITNKNDNYEEKVKIEKDDDENIFIDYTKKEKKLGKKLNLYEVWSNDAYSFFGINAKQKGNNNRDLYYELFDDVFLPKQSSIVLNNQQNVARGTSLVSHTSNIDKYLAEKLITSFHNKFTAHLGMTPLNKNK